MGRITFCFLSQNGTAEGAPVIISGGTAAANGGVPLPEPPPPQPCPLLACPETGQASGGRRVALFGLGLLCRDVFPGCIRQPQRDPPCGP